MLSSHPWVKVDWFLQRKTMLSIWGLDNSILWIFLCCAINFYWYSFIDLIMLLLVVVVICICISKCKVRQLQRHSTCLRRMVQSILFVIFVHMLFMLLLLSLSNPKCFKIDVNTGDWNMSGQNIVFLPKYLAWRQLQSLNVAARNFILVWQTCNITSTLWIIAGGYKRIRHPYWQKL